VPLHNLHEIITIFSFIG